MHGSQVSAAQLSACESRIQALTDLVTAQGETIAAQGATAARVEAAVAEQTAAVRDLASAFGSAASSGEGGHGAARRQADRATEERRHSLKASFMAKVMSPIIGYGTDHALAQFVYVNRTVCFPTICRPYVPALGLDGRMA